MPSRLSTHTDTAGRQRPTLGVTQVGADGEPLALFVGSSYFAETATNLAASGTLNGASRDAGATPSRFRQFVAEAFSDQAGTLYVDKSVNGSTWRQAASVAVAAGANGSLSVAVTARYCRLRFVNGATAQTVFLPTTAFLS